MQEVIVSLIVFIAAVAVAKRYLPRKMKQALQARMASMLRGRGWHKAAARLETNPPSGSCNDGCGTCGACESPGSSSTATGKQIFLRKI